MTIRRYNAERSTEEVADFVRRNFERIQDFATDVAEFPLLDGVLLEDVAYSGSAVTVLHGLGRKWRGYVVTKRDAAESVATTDANNPDGDRLAQIVFTASGNVTFDAWVF